MFGTFNLKLAVFLFSLSDRAAQVTFLIPLVLFSNLEVQYKGNFAVGGHCFPIFHSTSRFKVGVGPI